MPRPKFRLSVESARNIWPIYSKASLPSIVYTVIYPRVFFLLAGVRITPAISQLVRALTDLFNKTAPNCPSKAKVK